jgi:hypothetical protein
MWLNVFTWPSYTSRYELAENCYVPCLILVLRAHLCFPYLASFPYLYLPDRSAAYTGLTSAVAAISMLSSYRPNTSTSVRTMPTFLFRLTFLRLSNHSLASSLRVIPSILSTRESVLCLLTQTLLLLTKYDTAHQSAHF